MADETSIEKQEQTSSAKQLGVSAIAGVIGALVPVVAAAFYFGGLEQRVTTLENTPPPQGTGGPQGPQGLQGPTGPQGPPGPAGTARIPNGLVVAFDLPRGCPSGWSEFADAAGRVIIGAGNGMLDQNRKPLTNRKYREHGGEEEHILTDAEMPAHHHATALLGREVNPFGTTPREPGWKYIAGYREFENRAALKTSTVGRSRPRPINNMPPYVALYFCKKD